MSDDNVRTWLHSRKGIITGAIIDETSDGVWVTIRLHGAHSPRYASEANRGRIHEDGDTLTLRRSLMREVAS